MHRLLVEEQQDGRAYVATGGASAAGAAVSAAAGAGASRSAAAAGSAVGRVEVLGRVVEVLVEGLVAVATPGKKWLANGAACRVSGIESPFVSCQIVIPLPLLCVSRMYHLRVAGS